MIEDSEDSIDVAGDILYIKSHDVLICLCWYITNSMAYGTQRFNAAFTRALQ